MKCIPILLFLLLAGCSSGGSDSNASEPPTPDPVGDCGTGDNCDPAPDPDPVPDPDPTPDQNLDTDNDGVIDTADACPNQGSEGLGIDASGCQLTVPVPQRNTSAMQLAQEQSVSAFGESWELDFYRNQAYSCGLSGNYSFLVMENGNSVGNEAPLWVYLHGGGVGYFDEAGGYPAVTGQTQFTWNEEETFSDLWDTQVRGRVLDSGGGLIDNTLKRRIEEGYRLLVVSMCDHDLYSGLGNAYPNSPNGGQTNGLQATMAAIEFTAENYPTTHVFAHGTSAGSVGVFSLASSFAQEQTALTGIVADSFVITPRLIPLIENYAGVSGFPFVSNFTVQGVINKIGFFADPEQSGFPEAKVAGGFNATPMLFLGGDADNFCAGNLTPIDEAAAANLNNCDWVYDNLRQAIANQTDSPHQMTIIDGAGHTPTNSAGAVNNIVDNFVSGVLAGNPDMPFN